MHINSNQDLDTLCLPEQFQGLTQYNLLFLLENIAMAKTTKKTEEKVEEVKAEKVSAKETVQETVKNTMDSYFDGLADSRERFAADVSKARARNSRIMDSFLQTLENGQKDMLELSRAVAAAPTDYRGNLQLAMETMNRRQECALEFGKTLYREQTEMTSEVSERAKEVFAPLRNADFDWTAPYKQMTAFWAPSAK